jgi:putative membrane protein
MNVTFNRFTKALVIFVVFDFFMFFILEAIFWMQPFVYNILLEMFNNPPKSLNFSMHALVLKKLFINQGFYNLFFALGGLAGLFYINKNKAVGYALILLVCFSATGAGIVLAVTSKAYILAFLQAVPAAVALFKVYPLFKKELDLSNY